MLKTFAGKMQNENYLFKIKTLRKKLSNISFKNICSLGIAINILFIIALIVSLNVGFGYNVIVNDKNYGVVSTVKEANLVIGDSLKEIKGVKSPKFQFNQSCYAVTLCKKDKLIPTNNIKNNIVADLDGLVSAYSIIVDKNNVVSLNSQVDAENILLEIQSQYKTQSNKVSFGNDVNINKTRVSANDIVTPDKALEILKGTKQESICHTVQEGETFDYIAIKYGISNEELKNLNPQIVPDNLSIGSTLTLNAPIPIVKVKSVEDITVIEKIDYEITPQDDPNTYKGIRKVISNGVCGTKNTVYEVTKINNQISDQKPISETVLTNPVTEIVAVGTKVKPKTEATGSFLRPYFGTVTSRFGSRWGRKHNGVDYGGKIGDPVNAADGGEVTYAGWYSGYGNFIKINHDNGFETYYGHLNSIEVTVGQKVAKGDLIGKVGNTGNSTGPHLHFEVRKNGAPQNPAEYVN